MNILQIGVNDAKDKLFDFCSIHRKGISKAIFVDASIDSLNEAKERYKAILPNAIFIEAAVIDTNIEFVEFFYPIENKVSGHSSLIRSYLERGGYTNIGSKKVSTKRINSLLDMFNGEIIDRVYIDVEGLDPNLILDIDYSKYLIPFINFESAHSDGHFTKGIMYQRCIHKLKETGYTLFEVELDTYGVKI